MHFIQILYSIKYEKVKFIHFSDCAWVVCDSPVDEFLLRRKNIYLFLEHLLHV